MPSKLGTALVLGLLGGLGCVNVFGSEDAMHPGDELGTYTVAAVSTSNTCGEGALGAASSWSFDVRLSRAETVLYWDNGVEVIPGSLGDDGLTFSFTTGTITDMRAAGFPGTTPCSVQRTDGAAGVLSSTTTDVASFSATLSYAYAATAGSECSDLVAGTSAAPLFAALPCGVVYGLAATRTVLPE